MEQSTATPEVLQTQRTLPFTADAIYAAFAEPQRLAAWWGPDGFTNSFETFEFKVGGAWKFIMHGPDGNNYPNESVFSELVPNQKIVIRHVCAPLFTLTVTLTPNADGTLVGWHQDFADAKLVAAIRHIVEPSNEQNLDRLHQHLRGDLK